MLEIRRAESEVDIQSVRLLIRAFAAWQRERNRESLDILDRYFGGDAFEHELATLGVKYGPPRGCLLLATWSDAPAGCVALREIDQDDCEMKRLFVYPGNQGKGFGKALGSAVIEEARVLGYKRMLLDTSFRQTEAQALYHGLGFEDIGPYYEMPNEVRDWLVFMQLML